MTLILPTEPKSCVGSAIFTQNDFAAAPVFVSKAVLSSTLGKGLNGVVINSGCANACTGNQGLLDASLMSQSLDSLVTTSHSSTATPFPTPSPSPSPSLSPSPFPTPISTLSTSLQSLKSIVMSTGVIGQLLPISKIESHLPILYNSLVTSPSPIESSPLESYQSYLQAATGIMTTDTFPKFTSQKFHGKSQDGNSREYSIAGIAKGAGMIHPNLVRYIGMSTLSFTSFSPFFSLLHLKDELFFYLPIERRLC